MELHLFDKTEEKILVKIEGIILEIVYRNEENGYTVLEIEVDGELTVAVGSCPHVVVGEYAKLYGVWTEHKSYGRQFKITSVETSLPENPISIEMYLSSGIIKGIGPVTAEKIVGEFGTETFEIIENDHERLSDIKGISKALSKNIHESFMKNAALKIIIMKLQTLGLSVKQAFRAHEKYGGIAEELIKENPYRMIDDIYGIGFERADRIAEHMGIDREAPFRVENGIKHVLKLALNEGHTCLPEDMLIRKTSDIIGVPVEMVEKSIADLASKGEIAKKLYSVVTAVFLTGSYIAESETARRLFMLCKSEPKMKVKDIEGEIEHYAGSLEMSDEQKSAVKNALMNNVSIITGGPGTGKTTIIKVLLKIMEANGIMTALCAPTGRAAKRMEESCRKEAKTIHRLLEFGYNFDDTEEYFKSSRNKFMRNEENPLVADEIIVDEVSMVDIFLANAFLKAVSEGTRVIFVGDADQLPSVGAGNFLRDVIKSEFVPVFRLTKFYRQQEGGNIIANAHRINLGSMPNMYQTGDFIYIPAADPEATLETLLNLIKDEEFSEAQILCPLKKGIIGVHNINQKVREQKNPGRVTVPELKKGETVYRKGDKIIQTSNNYNKEWILTSHDKYYQQGFGVFNGDVGCILDIDKDSKLATILFEDRQAEYTQNELEQLEHAYAITVHKSQGSEFDTVILPLFYGSSPFLTKNLLYTAVTRAKKKVVLIGLLKTVSHMVNNNRITRRYTVLNNEIMELVDIFDKLDEEKEKEE